MRRRLFSSVLVTNRCILSRQHYYTSRHDKPTKKANSHEPTHKFTRKPWEEVSFLTDLKEIEEPEEALALFNQYQEMGFRHDYPSYSSLIYKLAKSRNFDAVDQILRLIRYRNVRCRESLFIALIQHYGKAGSVDKAVDVFHKMTSFDCVRTIQSLNTLINVLVDNSELEKAKSFFDGAKDLRLRPNSVSFNILIKGFLDKCDWEAACKVFDEMLEMEVQPSVVTYNSLIGFLCRNNDLGKAKSLLEDMFQKRIRPNAVTFGLLMKGLCCKGDYSEAKKLMFDMEYRGCKPGLVNYGVLMSDLGVRGKIDEAKLLLSEMKKRRIKPDVVIYNILVNHLCTEGRATEAYRILTEMQMKGCKPNAATYRMMVDGFCRIGDFDSALDVLNAMLASRHFPTPATFVCMVAGLIKGGNLDHACFVLETYASLNAHRRVIRDEVTKEETLVEPEERDVIQPTTTAVQPRQARKALFQEKESEVLTSQALGLGRVEVVDGFDRIQVHDELGSVVDAGDGVAVMEGSQLLSGGDGVFGEKVELMDTGVELLINDVKASDD
ncbi:hypothetical protein CARUB_v10007904mg, partial [Capsella rubella]